MDQKFPSDWPSLPDSVIYEKELSERFTTESEPEYIIRSTDGVRFLIREYEGGNKDIITYDLRDYSIWRLSDDEKFFLILKQLYSLLECDFLHSPPEDNVQYRGYHRERETVWEYHSHNEIIERPPEAFTVSSFHTVEPNKQLLENKGKHLATAKDHNIQQLSVTNEESTDCDITYEFYENVAIYRTEDSTKGYPIPETILIVNTVSNMIESNRREVIYIDESIKSNLLSMNI